MQDKTIIVVIPSHEGLSSEGIHPVYALEDRGSKPLTQKLGIQISLQKNS